MFKAKRIDTSDEKPEDFASLEKLKKKLSGTKLTKDSFSRMMKMKKRGLRMRYVTVDNLGPDKSEEITGDPQLEEPDIFPVEEGVTTNVILAIPDQMMEKDRSNMLKTGIEVANRYDHRFNIRKEKTPLEQRLSTILARKGMTLKDIRTIDRLGSFDPKFRHEILSEMGLIGTIKSDQPIEKKEMSTQT